MELNLNRKKKADIIIAIDPDVEKSGVALLDVEKRKLKVASFPFPDLIDYFSHIKREYEIKHKCLIAVVEAGWLNNSNWHIGPRDTRAIAAAKGNATGRNQETGRKIIEMARHIGLNVEEIKPLRKYWKGKDGKITPQELQSFTGFKGRSNQDGRDAALIAWVYAGLPIRISHI